MRADINIEDFEIWRRNISVYLALTVLNQAPRQTQVATLRGFLSSDMYSKLRIAAGVEDDTDMELEQIREALRKSISSKRNIALDRTQFEERKQLEGET